MGQSHGLSDLAEPFSQFSSWRLEKAAAAVRSFQSNSMPFAISLHATQYLSGLPPSDAEFVFNSFVDNQATAPKDHFAATINALSLLSVMVVLSDASRLKDDPTRAKLAVLFDLMDVENSGSLSFDEMAALSASALAGMQVALGIPGRVDEKLVEAQLQQGFERQHKPLHRKFRQKQFIEWVVQECLTLDSTTAITANGNAPLEFITDFPPLPHLVQRYLRRI